jgi:putative heme degradation protein
MTDRTGLEKEGADRFKAEWNRLLVDLPTLGRVRLVIRNQSAVSEMLGALDGCRLSKGWFTVENEHFHLHLKADDVIEGYFVEKIKEGKEGVSRSIQLVSREGQIVLKLFLLEKEPGSSQGRLYEKLKEAYAS